MDHFDWTVCLNGLGCAAGGFLPLAWARRGEPGGAVHGFAAGVLLGAAWLVLIPAAARDLGADVGVPVLSGFLVLYLLDRLLLGAEVHHGADHAEAGHAHHIGPLAVVGFSVHTLADGAALGLAGATPELGFPVLLGVLFHEAPAQFVFARLLVASGTRRSTIALGVALLSGSMVAMAYLARHFAGHVEARSVASGIGAAAGMFLFLATAELLPREHQGRRGRGVAMIAFFAGIGLSALAHWIGDHA